MVDHLDELRWRLIALLAWATAGFVAAWVVRDELFALLNRPLAGEYRIQTLAVTEPFFTSLTVAAHAAVIVSFPMLAWHAYRFVAPALEPSQRRGILALTLAAPALFYAGVAFCYLLVLGPAVQFLLGFGQDGFEVAVRAREYYGFVSTTLLATGVVFLLPLLLLGLARIGLVTSQMLRDNRRAGFVVVAAVAALLPTADVVSLAVEILALLGLFELSILLVRLQERSAARMAARGDATG